MTRAVTLTKLGKDLVRGEKMYLAVTTLSATSLVSTLVGQTTATMMSPLSRVHNATMDQVFSYTGNGICGPGL